MLCFVPCCEVQQIFFSGSPWVGVGLSELWILKKSAMKMVIFTIIVVITSNLIRKITLNMLCFVPCCEVQQIFFFWLSMGRGNAFSYHNFEIERSQYCKWYVPRTPNSSFYFPKASCNCWKRFSVYTFPRFLFLRNSCFCRLTPNGCTFEFPMYVIRIRCKHWTWRGCISLCLSLVVVLCVN